MVSFLKKKDHEEDQPASRQFGHLGRVARRACRHGESKNRENRAKAIIYGGWQGGRVAAANRKIAKISLIRSSREHGKAGVSPWWIGKSRKSRECNHVARMARRACRHGGPGNRAKSKLRYQTNGGGSKRGVQDSSGITSSIYLRWFRAGRVRGGNLLLRGGAPLITRNRTLAYLALLGASSF